MLSRAMQVKLVKGTAIVFIAIAIGAILMPRPCLGQTPYLDGHFSGRMNWDPDGSNDMGYYQGFAEGRAERRDREVLRQMDEWRRDDEREYERRMDDMIDAINDRGDGYYEYD